VHFLNLKCGTKKEHDLMNFRETLAKCAAFGFNEAITRQTLWNEAYQLGRSRWYWGPQWMVELQGWLNTRKAKIAKRNADKTSDAY